MIKVLKRSVTIRGHRTSFSLESAFFDALAFLARQRGVPFASLVAEVDAARPRDTNLSSALRLHVLEAAMAGGFSRSQCRSDKGCAAGTPVPADS